MERQAISERMQLLTSTSCSLTKMNLRSMIAGLLNVTKETIFHKNRDSPELLVETVELLIQFVTLI